jgi:hypothetical protein
MTLLEKISYFQKVWRLTLPHIEPPSPEDAVRWCPYSVDTVETALLRTARRFAPAKITEGFQPQQAYKYATAIARSINDQKGAQAQ